jgi:non-ribosomal peptide synthetase component E (peptide arylation enzyme)
MLDGCTPWPAEFAQRYLNLGYWQGITLPDMWNAPPIARRIRRRSCTATSGSAAAR